MATTKTDEMLVSLLTHTHGYRVIKRGQRVKGDDVIVRERPDYFIAESASDGEVAAAAEALHRERITRPDRELTKAERKRNDEILKRRATKRPASTSYGFIWGE